MQSCQRSPSVGSLRHRAATGATGGEKDVGAGFNITDSFGSENSPKIEDTQFGKLEPIHGYDTENELATRNKYDGDPFGNEEGNKVKYKTLTWPQTGFIMIAETISLGILSLPSVLAAVGLVAGIILIIGLGIIATYTGYVLGQFKIKYPYVHTMGDAGQILAGAWGREICGIAQTTFLVFIMGSHVLTFSIMMNVLTNHSLCTIWFMIIGTVISFICTLPRTLKSVSHLSIISFASVVAAIMITMIGVGLRGRPAGVVVENTTDVTFDKAFIGVMNIVFAYAGHLAFFAFISEMKDPEKYPYALYSLQISDTCLYLIAAVVIYYYTGKDVASPALGSTGPLLRKIAYGIASPTIIIAGVINAHVAAKYVYLRMFRGTKHLGSGSSFSDSVWVIILLILWVIAWVIAEAIPSFNHLLALISSLFVSWFTYGISGAMWLHINKGQLFQNWKKTALTIINFSICVMGIVITVLGLYASGKAIHDDTDGSLGAFSCNDNSI
ncbi:transmembrane amino acid transporter protein-domain-containing protein [Terfezia claveryi]|nr:transmembrane amino acid transporter protein-domain-containing protein [Terfezia claveryi]